MATGMSMCGESAVSGVRPDGQPSPQVRSATGVGRRVNQGTSFLLFSSDLGGVQVLWLEQGLEPGGGADRGAWLAYY
jgi:hypothetical protein